MFKQISIALGLIVTPFIITHAIDYQAQIKKYAQCEALQNVVANVLSQSEEEYLKHELHLAAKDSRIVMQEFVRVSGIAPEFAEELYAVYLDEYRKALIPNGQDNQLDLFIGNIRPQLNNCKELNEIQADIINRHKNRPYQ